MAILLDAHLENNPLSEIIYILSQSNQNAENITSQSLYLADLLSDEVNLIPCANARNARHMYSILRQIRPDLDLVILPEWETLPYDEIAVSEKVIATRLDIFSKLSQGESMTLIMTPGSLLQRLPTKDWFNLHRFSFKKQQIVSLHNLKETLKNSGYTHCHTVEKFGQYAQRGDILDFFPSSLGNPIRIEFFDDEINRMQIFDVETQRSIRNIEEFNLTSSREFLLTQASISHFVNRWWDIFDTDQQKCSIFRAIKRGEIPAGIEYYLSMLHTRTCPIFDLVEHANLYLHRGIVDHIQSFLRDCQARYQAICVENKRNILPVDQVWMPWSTFRNDSISRCIHINVANNPWKTTLPSKNYRTLHCFAQQDQFEKTKLPKCTSISEFSDSSHQDAAILLDLPLSIQNTDLKFTLQPVASSDRSKHYYINSGTGTEHFINARGDITGGREGLRFNELTLNSLVVHETWGICIYRGLKQMEDSEFLTFEFANNEMLYLPLVKLFLITNYHANHEDVVLDSLKKSSFSKRIDKVKKNTEDIAAKMLEYYGKRQTEDAHIIRPNEQEFNAFVSLFPYHDTAGQRHASHQILHDLDSIVPMDRLLCGDVGYGKTEVAIRAAVATVLSGYQVCIMVPTTLLAQQHYETFQSRCSSIEGLRIEKLDSSITTTERRKLSEDLEKGTIDIVIATQAVVKSEWKFKQLALLVIDEEHRFGVKDKEKLQSYKHNVHVLRMSSTPIPRTMQRAISGIDQISYLDAPPPSRLPVSTFIKEWNDHLISDILKREYQRAGQSFVVVDRINGLVNLTQHIKALLPEMTVAYAHGRMSGQHNQTILENLRSGQIDVLVSTNIIQSGLDIPNCNTMIIVRADRTGLAELHQLRGRVGRSERQSWCWCLHPPSSLLTPTALRRLSIMKNSASTGAGFEMAMNDLEMRGMGELLGFNQSGLMSEIGMQLYCKILQQTIDLQNSEPSPNTSIDLEQTQCSIEIPSQSYIPADYIQDPVERLKAYQKITRLQTQAELQDFRQDLQDRFGTANDKVAEYMRSVQLLIAAKILSISKIGVASSKLEIHWQNISPEEATINKMLLMIKKNPLRYSYIPNGLSVKLNDTDSILGVAQATVDQLNISA